MTEWKLVPVEPTAEMKRAGRNTWEDGYWDAMLAAAPPPTITDEMVERAARAMYERTGIQSWDECPDTFKEVLRDDNRAALTAALGGKDE